MASGTTPRQILRRSSKNIWQLLPVATILCPAAAKIRNARLIIPSESKKKKSRWRNRRKEWRRTRQSKQHLPTMDWHGEPPCLTIPRVTLAGEKLSLVSKARGRLNK